MARISGHTSEETKELLKSTFIAMNREKSIEHITIGELTKKACVNRSTFYYYFEDIYHLAEQIEQDFLRLIEDVFPHIISGILDQNFDEHLTALIDFYVKYREQYLFFMVERPNQKIIRTIQNYAQDYALQRIGLKREQLTLQQRLIAEYVAHAQLGMIGWWMQNGQEYSIPELSQLIMQINMQGPFPTLFHGMERVEAVDKAEVH